MENYLPDPPENCHWQVWPNREDLSVSLGLYRTKGDYTYAVASERHVPGLADPEQLKEAVREKAYDLLCQYQRLVAIESVAGTFYKS
jgi:hypothetical protein